MLNVEVRNLCYENNMEDLANALSEIVYDIRLNGCELDEDGCYCCQVNGVIIEVTDEK